jgi:HAE1 family hydrophobic/amphiphilic exporter-1
MKIGTIFVKRPVMTTMLYSGLALFGMLSWAKMSQELFPNISVPKLLIITKYANAAPEEIEHLITKPIEEAVGTVPNLKRISSVSKEGLSAVTLDFSWGTDVGFSHLSVREKIDRIKDRLPQEAEESIIKRVNPFAHPVLILSVTGDLNLAEMTELCDQVIKKKLEKTDGVGSVAISGGQKREILVEVDRGRLEASRVSLPMVVDALKNANYNYPAGVTQGKTVEYLVRTDGQFRRVDDIGKTIVQIENPEYDPVYRWKKSEGRQGDTASGAREQRLIPLHNIAEIKESLEEKTSFSRYNGKENISISIQKHADANTVEVSKAVRTALAELKASLPPGLGVEVIYDESEYIVASLGNMRNNVLVGGFLAFIVLLYFLGNAKDAMVVGLAIPASLLFVFIVMFFMGMSVNMLTLAGLALGVGSLTDCSICIAENITRHREEYGKSYLDAAVDGADEMFAPMLSASLTNIAVFLPLLFVTGVAQQLFKDLFYVTVLTNLASLLVALTLIPRMSAYEWAHMPMSELVKKMKVKEVGDWIERAALWYKNSVDRVLKDPKMLFTIIGGLSVLALLVLSWTPKVFMPKMDQRQFYIQLDMPIGTRLDVTNSVAKKLESILLNTEGLDVMVSIGSAQEDEDVDALGAHQAQIAVKLGPKVKADTHQILEKFVTQSKRENLEGGNLTYVLQDSPIKSALSGGAAMEVEIKGPDLARLEYISTDLLKKMEQDPSFYGVKSTLALPSQETQVVPDKDRAAGFELSVADIARTALIAIKGMVATKFKEGGEETNIRVRLRQMDRDDNASIRQLALRSPRGSMVPLDGVAQIRIGRGSSEIRHLDQQRSVIVSAETRGSTSKAISKVRKMIADYRAFKDYTVELGGESSRISESFATLQFTFLLAIILVYMIMAAEFENTMQPLIIMLTVPFSFIGVTFTLALTGTRCPRW